MSGSISGVGSCVWGSCEEALSSVADTVDAVLVETGEITKVFIKKAKEIEFFYYNMKLVPDVIMPIADWTGNTLGESAEILKGAIKGPLKGFVSFATIGSSCESSAKKISALFKSGVFEAGAYASAAGSVCGTFNKAHDLITVSGRILKIEVLSTISSAFSRINSTAICAGAVFRTAIASESLYAHVTGLEGAFGSQPAREKQYEHVVSGALNVISNVAIVIIGGALLLESFAVITPLALGCALTSAGFVGGLAKVGKYYYDARNDLPVPPPVPVRV